MIPPRVVVVCGGLGGARIARAFREAYLAEDVLFVTNVADDIVWDGALVCPDTDAVLYSLAGLFDHQRGWGIAGDQPRPGADAGEWFAVGRRDRALHEQRQALLGTMPLSAATGVLARQHGVIAAIVPATDQPVRTVVRYGGGWHGFQEWLVRDHAPPAEAVAYDGLGSARPAPGVCDAIAEGDVVVLASSSPVASIDPTLALPGVREALQDRRGRTVSVSPVASRPFTCERDRRRALARARLLAAVGSVHTPSAVAARYADVIDTFVLDPADAVEAGAVASLGLNVELAPVTGDSARARQGLLAALLAVSGRR